MESQKVKRKPKGKIKEEPLRIGEETKEKTKRKRKAKIIPFERVIPQFQKSNKSNYKYDVITPSGKVVRFGDKRYQHYKDTALGLFQHLDHGDEGRRELYFKGHGKIVNKDTKLSHLDVESPSYYSWKYLWSGKTD